MRLAILGFVGGAALLQMQAALPGPAAMAACLFAFLLLLMLRRLPARVLAAALAGFLWAASVAHLALRHELAAANEGRDITLIGTIDSLPYQFEQGARFNVNVEHAIGDFAVPPRVALAWYGEAIDVQPGQRWQLAVRLQRPHGNANPYGFDYEAWLLEQGLRATGYVRTEGSRNRKIDDFVVSATNVVERSRAMLRTRITGALEGKPYKGVIIALVIGDQRGIGQSDWALFNRTGIGHLVSISGLHITMVAGLFALLASSLWRRSFFTKAQLPLLIPAQKVAALAGLVVAFVYVLLAGFGVPAQRTLYMIGVVAAALWFGRITSVSHVLCAALGVVVLLDPWAMLWPGFWLSFGAVAAILFATAGRQLSAVWLALHTQYVVTIGLVPLSLVLFAQVSVVGPIANAIAIPLVSFVVTPLSLIGSLLPQPLMHWVLGFAHWCIEMLALFLTWIGNTSWSVWTTPVPPAWAFAFATAGTLWVLAPRGWPGRWIGLLAWAPLLAAKPTHPAPGQLMVTAFDVGQGTALLVETASHRLLYDTGPAYTPESNGGNRVIAPYLRARGIGTLDAMVVSHADADHAGGALATLASVRVGWTISSLADEHAIVAASQHHTRCKAGQAWHWDGAMFEILHPVQGAYDDAALTPNARSCVLKISIGGRAILLAGDIEAAQEAQLIEQEKGSLAAEVLLAPHHGSGTSSTTGFLAAVRPSVALFQVGYRNRYHHPKAQILARYRDRGIVNLRSDDSGAVTLVFGPQLEVRQFRTEHARYWYGR